MSGNGNGRGAESGDARRDNGSANGERPHAGNGERRHAGNGERRREELATSCARSARASNPTMSAYRMGPPPHPWAPP